jgi:DNA gyrase/topoisomerase IV subunit A
VENQKKLADEHSELLAKVQRQEKELAQQKELIQSQAKEIESLKTLFHVLMSVNKPTGPTGSATSSPEKKPGDAT